MTPAPSTPDGNSAAPAPGSDSGSETTPAEGMEGPDDVPVSTPSSATTPMAPVTSPTASSVKCKSTDGTFGSLQGEELVVPFLYYVELSENLVAKEYSENLLPDLETDITDYLLPFVFEECALGQQQRNLFGSRRHLASTVAGMSSRPGDTITDQVDCGAVENCVGMLGQVSLYFQDNGGAIRRRSMQDETTEAQKLRDALEQGMTSGRFDNNPPIVRVRYVQGNINSIIGIEGEGSNGGGGGDRSIAVGAPFAVAGGLMIMVIGVIVFRRRQTTTTPRWYDSDAASQMAAAADESIV